MLSDIHKALDLILNSLIALESAYKDEREKFEKVLGSQIPTPEIMLNDKLDKLKELHRDIQLQSRKIAMIEAQLGISECQN